MSTGRLSAYTLLSGLLIVAVGVWIGHTSWARTGAADWIGARLLGEGAACTVHRVAPGWLGSIEGTAVRCLEDGANEPLLSVDSAWVKISIAPVLLRRVDLVRVELAGVELRLAQRGDGSWGWRSQERQRPGSADPWSVVSGPIELRRVRVALEPAPRSEPSRTRILEARAHVAGLEIGSDLSVRSSVDSVIARFRPAGAPDDHTVRLFAVARFEGGVLSIDSLDLASPGSALTASGRVRGLGREGPLELDEFRIVSERLDLRDLRILLPTLSVGGTIGIETTFSGPMESLADLLTSSAGH